MKLILVLTIGHLIGDFLFQTEKIVLWKQKELKGIVFHGIIVALAMGLVLLPFYPQLYWLVAIQGLFHILIDWGKIKISFPIPGQELISFLLDQFMHLGVILGSVYFLVATERELQPVQEISETLLYIITAYLVATVFAAIFLQVIVNQIFPQPRKQPFLFWQSRFTGLIERILVTTSILSSSFFLLIIGFLITPAAYYFKYLQQEERRRIWCRYIFSLSWAVLIALTLKLIIY